MAIWGTSRNLLARFEIQDSAELLGKFEVRQGSAELLGRFEAQAAAELLGIFEIQDSAELLGKFEVRQDSAGLLGKAEIKNSGTAELLSKFEAQDTAELLSKAKVQQSASTELLGKFEAQATAELLGKFEAQATTKLLGKVDITHSVELLGKFEAQATAELLGKFEIGQGSADLLGKVDITHSVELLGKTDITHSVELLGKFEVGQDSADLLGRGDVRQSGSAELLGRFEAQATAELLGKFEIGQDSAELLGKFEVGQDSAELLGSAIIRHPTFPVWLFGKFEVGLTNAHQELGSILELRRTALVELFDKAVVRHSDSEELFGKAKVKNIGSSELLGNAIIKNVGSAELLCGFAAQTFGDLKAKFIIGPAKASDTYISFFDPSDWINEVVGMGQGFIAIPWVEADADVKTSGDSSARLTSTSAPNQYKEIRFGWGGMNWGVEAAVPPEVAPTPIDTDGRGPRRGSRAERDQRREVPQSSYKDLAGLFVTQAINELRASFFAMVNYTSWSLVWTRDYGAGVTLDGVYVDNSGGCYITDEVNTDVYFRSYAGVETSNSDYGYMVPRRESLPVAISEGGIRYVVGENELIFDQFDIWRDGAIVASINPVTDLGADFNQWLAIDMSASGKYIAFVIEGLSGRYYVMLYEGS